MKVFKFQDHTHKSDCATCCERTVFDLLKKPVGKQDLKLLRILVPPEILVPIVISAQFERRCLRSTDNFPDLLHTKDFDIYDPVAISNFPKELPQNKYIRIGS